MPWYAWLLLAGGVIALLVLAVLRALQASERGRRFLRLPLRARVHFVRALLADPTTPPAAKVLLVGVVAYLALPFDLLPDFIPILGQADDVLVIAAAILLLLLFVPRDSFERALVRAEESHEQRRAARARPAGGSA